jgi:tetrahydromethanopterin S-methyltransferase subunit F
LEIAIGIALALLLVILPLLMKRHLERRQPA